MLLNLKRHVSQVINEFIFWYKIISLLNSVLDVFQLRSTLSSAITTYDVYQSWHTLTWVDFLFSKHTAPFSPAFYIAVPISSAHNHLLSNIKSVLSFDYESCCQSSTVRLRVTFGRPFSWSLNILNWHLSVCHSFQLTGEFHNGLLVVFLPHVPWQSSTST